MDCTDSGLPVDWRARLAHWLVRLGGLRTVDGLFKFMVAAHSHSILSTSPRVPLIRITSPKFSTLLDWPCRYAAVYLPVVNPLDPGSPPPRCGNLPVSPGPVIASTGNPLLALPTSWRRGHGRSLSAHTPNRHARSSRDYGKSG